MEGHPRNIPVILFQNPSTGIAEMVLTFFLFIALVAILFHRVDRLSNIGGGSPEENSCIIILKSIHWLRRRSPLKVFSSGGHLVQWRGTV